MRKYLRQSELIQTLEQIMNEDDPALTQICREVIRLRMTRNAKKAPLAAAALLIPRFLTLHAINIFALPPTAILVLQQTFQLSSSVLFGVCLILCLWMLLETWAVVHFMVSLRKNRRYLLVDELFARKILVLHEIRRNTPARQHSH